jgi:non-ribosomal peptide synthetase-like protein
VVLAFVLFFPLSLGYFAAVERASLRFERMKPTLCSILDEPYWRAERYWKLSMLGVMFKGTPFKNIISRLLGVRVGKKVFDDGCMITEKTLLEIGDYATLNECTIQCHSLEDGIFKSDYTKIGKGSTLGVGAFVHYGVTTGENVILDADAFLMKGSRAEPDSIWQGNPARQINETRINATNAAELSGLAGTNLWRRIAIGAPRALQGMNPLTRTTVQ